MKSREFKRIYHPSLGRYVYEHRGNGLIVDNIMKPLKGAKGAISAAAKGARRAVARAIGKKASKTAKAVAAKATAKAEKSSDLIRRRLQNQWPVAPSELQGATKSRRRGRGAKYGPKMSNNDVNTLINNLIARS